MMTTAEDFLRNVLNHPPQQWLNMPPTFQEFKQVMMQIKSGKSHNTFELIEHGDLPLENHISTQVSVDVGMPTSSESER